MPSFKTAYRMPCICAIAGHLILICMMMTVVPKKTFRTESAVHASSQPLSQPVIQATTVDTKIVQKQMREIQLEAEKKKQAEKKAIQAIARRAALAAEKRVVEEQRLKQVKIQKQKMEQLATQQKILQDKLLKDMMRKESQELKALKNKPVAAETSSKAPVNERESNQGEIDKYRAAILHVIQGNWHPPEQNSALFCTVLVHVSVNGVVTAMELIRSSGDPALDRSAQIAVQKSSPLPMPKDPALLNEFRHLRIKMSPQDIQNN